MERALTSQTDTTALENLAMHEMGHALGLLHTNYEQDIMFIRRAGEYCPSNLNIEGLTAEEPRYSTEDWIETNC
jgi:predicted Zn-dependent protease